MFATDAFGKPIKVKDYTDGFIHIVFDNINLPSKKTKAIYGEISSNNLSVIQSVILDKAAYEDGTVWEHKYLIDGDYH